MLDMLLDIIRGRKRRPKAPQASMHAPSKKHEFVQKLTSETHSLHETITDKNVKLKAREFYALVKGAFRDALGIKYEVTFQEIQEEINNKRHFSTAVREEVNSFLDELAMMEYGYEEFRDLVDEKRHAQEKLLHEYISDLEKEGEHLKANTKKKITEIVSESVPHSDREFLIRMVDRFKPMIHQIF